MTGDIAVHPELDAVLQTGGIKGWDGMVIARRREPSGAEGAVSAGSETGSGCHRSNTPCTSVDASRLAAW